MTCLPLFLKKKVAKLGKRTIEFDEEVSGIQNTNMYSYNELRMATENFSPTNKLGEGGFGSVFKGKLRDGTFAAIKILSAESSQGVPEFLTEINLIANMEHDNLVKLYGCCVEGKHRILVYGYVENNSLRQTLLGGGKSGIQFNWRARFNICVGVSKGLAFLHEEVQPRIIHRDIKASNILLDKNLVPKISDFGLAKLFPDNLTHISTRVAGTVGYLAPEYALRGQLTRKADIYSFGVLVLEIVSGRCNTDKRLQDEKQYLLETAWELYDKRELVGLVDESLNGDFDVEEACRVIKIGLLCTQENPTLRPSMSKVIKMLMGKIDVSDTNILRPGILSEFKTLRLGDCQKENPDTKKTSGTTSTSTSGMMDTSYATMTFTSIDDRSN